MESMHYIGLDIHEKIITINCCQEKKFIISVAKKKAELVFFNLYASTGYLQFIIPVPIDYKTPFVSKNMTENSG